MRLGLFRWSVPVLLAAPFQAGCAVSAKTHAAGHMRAAAAAMRNYEYQVVLNELDAAHSVQGSTPESESLRAAVFERLGMTERAETGYRRAAVLCPSYSLARSNLAALLIARGHFQEAVDQLEAALTLDPDNAVLLNNLGVARWALGNTKGAGEALAKAVKADPRDAHAATNHAIALWEQGHVRQAVVELQAAVYMDEMLADARGGLAVALWSQGQRGAAVKALETARRVDATFHFPELVKRKYHWPPRAVSELGEITPHLPALRPRLRTVPDQAVSFFGGAEYLDLPLIADVERDHRLAEEDELASNADH